MLDLERNDGEGAYTKWRDNHLLISRILKQESTMIERAIFWWLTALAYPL